MRTENEFEGTSHAERGRAESGVGTTDRDAEIPGAAQRGREEYVMNRPNLGSARSDYGSHAYGGSLDEEGLGGKSVGDYSRGRRDVSTRGYRRLRRDERSGWSGGWMLLGGIGLGAALMYLLDPDRGSRRRALVIDKLSSAANKTPAALGATSRDLRNRAQGLAASAKSVFTSADAPDEVIVQRVRSQIGRVVSHPSSIEVTANQGRVTLSGPVLASETDDLLSTVGKVRGVKDVENRLEVHEQAGNVPGLQGGQGESAAANNTSQARGASAPFRQ
ncbi:MAG: BON domain-containing protein [Acidobacteriota bacterium]|nr:BON domain-containing protein [Acidobacteriota bacterium]